jgi:flavin-binding protein dodecin
MREAKMSVARTTEIIAQSANSFDDAIREGVQRATQTLRNVKSVWIKDQEVVVRDNGIAGYEVTMKVTFVLDD